MSKLTPTPSPLLRAFARDDRGNFIVLTALAAPVMLAALAMAMSYSNAVKVQQQTQAAADAAALAATNAYISGQAATTAEAEAVGKSLFEADAPALALQNETRLVIVTTAPDHGVGGVRTSVDYEGAVPSLVSSLIGASKIEVSATGELPVDAPPDLAAPEAAPVVAAIRGFAPEYDLGGGTPSGPGLGASQNGCPDASALDGAAGLDPQLRDALKALVASCADEVVEGAAVTQPVLTR